MAPSAPTSQWLLVALAAGCALLGFLAGAAIPASLHAAHGVRTAAVTAAVAPSAPRRSAALLAGPLPDAEPRSQAPPSGGEGATGGPLGAAAAAAGVGGIALALGSRKLGLGRRQLAAGLGALAILTPLVGTAAHAELLPDDDDKELLALAKANRKERLAAERRLERETTTAAVGNSDSRYAPLQSLVVALANIGHGLEGKGVNPALAQEIQLADVADSVARASIAADTKALGVTFLTDLKGLQGAVQTGKLPEGRGAFVRTVASFKAWLAGAGVSGKIAGL